MKRTQIYLDYEAKNLVTRQAKLESSTVSHIIRKTIKAYFKSQSEAQKTGITNLSKWIAGLNKKYPTPPGTPTDLALEHDHYLYGTPKKYSK